MSAVKVRSLSCLLLCSFLAAFGQNFGSKPLFIEDIHVTGTRSLDSARLNEIIGPLNQMKVSNKEEVSERIRARFQDFGYFKAGVESLEVTPIDPLEKVPRVHVRAEVTEGPRFRLGSIEFKDIHAISADELRVQFPIKTGDYFSRSKVASGLEAVRKAYAKLGYIDFTSVPDTMIGGDNIIDLSIDVDEGHQFRMGELLLVGDAEVAQGLRPRWELDPGSPFDASYLDRFLKDNESVFPPQFDPSRSVKITRNCKEDKVTVFIELGPNHPNIAPPQNIACDQQSGK